MIHESTIKGNPQWITKQCSPGGVIGLGTLSLSDVYKDMHLPNSGVAFLFQLAIGSSTASTVAVIARKL